MLLTVNLKSEEPIYLQIRNRVVEGIASGALREGDPLPTVRALAAELGVNLHTVNKAYSFLRIEGFVKMMRSRGTVVTVPRRGRDTQDFLDAAAAAIKNIVTEAITRSVGREELTGMIHKIYSELEGKKK